MQSFSSLALLGAFFLLTLILLSRSRRRPPAPESGTHSGPPTAATGADSDTLPRTQQERTEYDLASGVVLIDLTLQASARPDATEATILKEVMASGAQFHLANRAYQFVTSACARTFLRDSGVTFSDEYLAVDSAGNVVETGSLSSDPWFQYAIQASEAASEKVVQTVGLRAAETAAVHQLLHTGSRPHDIVLTALVLMPPDVTDEGLARVHEFVLERAQARLKTEQSAN